MQWPRRPCAWGVSSIRAPLVLVGCWRIGVARHISPFFRSGWVALINDGAIPVHFDVINVAIDEAQHVLRILERRVLPFDAGNAFRFVPGVRPEGGGFSDQD